jgi:hypothetical protein
VGIYLGTKLHLFGYVGRALARTGGTALFFFGELNLGPIHNLGYWWGGLWGYLD